MARTKKTAVASVEEVAEVKAEEAVVEAVAEEVKEPEVVEEKVVVPTAVVKARVIIDEADGY